MSPYKPQDRMSLWSLATEPKIVGHIMLDENKRRVGLEYAKEWLLSGFNLSADIPLRPGFQVPTDIDAAAGAVDDARPDRWGERVIRHLYHPPRLSLMEFLYFAGNDRFGMLGVSLSDEAYVELDVKPEDSAILSFADLPAMQQAIEDVLAGTPTKESMKRLIKPGPSLGGAHPKSMIHIEQEPWIVKFSQADDDVCVPVVEHASMTLAQSCGIQAADTRVFSCGGRSVYGIKRFDRIGPQRIHAISAKTALKSFGQVMGYPELAQLFRRICRPEEIRQNQHELFRRMVFNILIDNTDDHEKNHALLRGDDGHYRLSPAFDVLPSCQNLGYQQMRVGKAGSESTLDNAMSETESFGLSKGEAQHIVESVSRGVSGWKEHFRRAGVTDGDIERIEGSSPLLDRPQSA